MPAYMIASFDVTDPEGYAAYVPGMMPVLMKYQPEILVADYEASSLEGECRQVNVVIKFPTEAALQAFYDDPDYRPFKELRVRTTANSTLLVAKEFVLPA
jgi:uncharacterized protein (DUF1330 family)